MGTCANFVAVDWGRTPQLFDLVDARPAEEPGLTVLELKLNLHTARRYHLNYGPMFHSTSWAYLHHLRLRRAELTIDDATGRILRETSQTNYGVTTIEFDDWTEHKGNSFTGSIRITNAERQFTVEYRFQVLPTGVWLLESGTSQFAGKQPQREELVDVQINAESPDVARHLTRVRSGLAELSQDAQTTDLTFESNLLRLGQRDALHWTGNDPALSGLTSLEFTTGSGGQRFREMPARPTLRARLRYDHPFPQVAAAEPLLFALYDDAGLPVQTHTIPVAALGTLQRPADSPVEPMDWSHVTDRVVSEQASLFDRMMAQPVRFETSPQFQALDHTRIAEPGLLELDLGRSSFLKHALSWTLSRATDNTTVSTTTDSRVSRTASSIPFRNGQRNILNATAKDSKTRLRSVELSRDANELSARIELISQEHYSEQYTRIVGVLFNPDGLPVALAELTSSYRVTEPVYQTDELQLDFGGVPPRTSNTLHAVFGIQTEEIGAPKGSRWMRFMSHQPLMPIPVLLSNPNSDVWKVGLTELYCHYRGKIDLASRYREDFLRKGLTRALAPYRDALRRLFETGEDPDGLALLCRLAGHSGDRSFVRRVAPLLKHQHRTVRDSAAVGLGLLGDGRASGQIRVVAAGELVEKDGAIGHLNLKNDAISALDILGMTTEE